MALIDLFGHYHANGLDNLKFYFNPVSFRIEPIGYDQSQLKDLHLNLNSFVLLLLLIVNLYYFINYIINN